MELFAANCTPQIFEFNYRVPESNRTMKQSIPSGGNSRIGDGTYNSLQIRAIIKQGFHYGMVDYDELERHKGPVTIIFRRNEPVPAGTIQEVLDRNRNELTETGRKRREELALAAARIMDPNNSGIADRVSLGIEEVEQGSASKESGKPLAEGFAGPESGMVRSGQLKPGNGKKGR